jgi:hypothetical protein
MKKLFKFSYIFALLALSPVAIFAATITPPFDQPVSSTTTCDSIVGVSKIICQLQQILASLIPVLVALGMVYFIWGVVNYMIADGEEAKTKGRDQIIYGIIGLAVIAGMWGLVNIVKTTFFGTQTLTAPTLEPLSTPSNSSSCSLDGDPKIQDLLCYFTKILNDSVIPLIFAIAMVMFIWGVVNFFIINADEEAKREQGRQFMIWGIIALAVMLSVWGLVGIVGSTFGIKGGSVLPKVCPSTDPSCK